MKIDVLCRRMPHSGGPGEPNNQLFLELFLRCVSGCPVLPFFLQIYVKSVSKKDYLFPRGTLLFRHFCTWVPNVAPKRPHSDPKEQTVTQKSPPSEPKVSKMEHKGGPKHQP